MGVSFSIDYPRKYDAADPARTRVPASTFVASADSPHPPGAVTGVLWDLQDPTKRWEGDTLPADPRRPLWAMAFHNIPPGSYALEIQHRGAGPLLGQLKPVRVQPTHGLGISYPLSNDSVRQDF